MNAKQAVLCCLLLVLVLHADHTLAGWACNSTSIKVPFCKGWSCKAECWLEARLTSTRVYEHECTRGGIKGRCYCRLCEK
ncbi:unnamed protein product [Urochloa decumbens]|uniref:Uncharacterized protein n=1 Tax=Urochloa decumbens TaxID=240449 RepID=A0ABC9DR18_9POAL